MGAFPNKELNDGLVGRRGADGEAGTGNLGEAFLQFMRGEPDGACRRLREDDLGTGSSLLNEDKIGGTCSGGADEEKPKRKRSHVDPERSVFGGRCQEKWWDGCSRIHGKEPDLVGRGGGCKMTV